VIDDGRESCGVEIEGDVGAVVRSHHPCLLPIFFVHATPCIIAVSVESEVARNFIVFSNETNEFSPCNFVAALVCITKQGVSFITPIVCPRPVDFHDCFGTSFEDL
jgi:hypothetical protein